LTRDQSRDTLHIWAAKYVLPRKQSINMTTKQAFMKAVEAMGCSAEYSKVRGNFDGFDLVVYAPDGMQFAATGTESDCSYNGITNDSGSAPDWGKCLGMLREIAEAGLQPADSE
jgi:hypothetical protein